MLVLGALGSILEPFLGSYGQTLTTSLKNDFGIPPRRALRGAGYAGTGQPMQGFGGPLAGRVGEGGCDGRVRERRGLRRSDATVAVWM